MNKNSQCIALIFAGGTGSRMTGAKAPKQFLKLGGKPIIAHTIEHFQRHDDVDSIVVVCVESGITLLEDIIREYNYKKVISIVAGGDTGQQSIYNGLAEINRLAITGRDLVVLVHDGVRPLIDEDTISSCIESVRIKGCTATVAPSVETVIESRDGRVERVLDRSYCKLARAPQGFLFYELWAAHEQAQKEGRTDFIDSISLMAHYGYDIHTVDGPIDNIKITTQRDFFAFKGYMDYKELSQLWEN